MKQANTILLKKLIKFSQGLLMVILFGVLASCSASDATSTADTDATDTTAFTVSDWTSSGVLETSINLVAFEQSNLENAESSNFYVAGVSRNYGVNSVYLTYAVSEDIPSTGTEETTAIGALYYPDTIDDIKGLIIYSPGTELENKDVKDSPGDYENFLKAYASHGYAIIYNYYIGLAPSEDIAGVNSGERHQRLSIMNSAEIQITALLDSFVDYAVDNNLSMPNKKLFLMGHSLGANYSAGYHLYYQTLSERKFNLTATLAGSGAYDFKQAYDESLLVYDRDKSSTGNVRFEHLALALPNFMYEWQHYYGGLVTTSDYKGFVGVDLTNSDDDFTFASNIYSHGEFSTTTNVLFSFTPDTQAEITNKTKAFDDGTNVYDFMDTQSVINRYTSNSIPLRAGYMPNDWDDPSISAKTLSETFSHVTFYNFSDECTDSIFDDKNHKAGEYCLIRSALGYFDGY
jgi:hypothetical protein